jgi:hypothetical protein
MGLTSESQLVFQSTFLDLSPFVPRGGSSLPSPRASGSIYEAYKAGKAVHALVKAGLTVPVAQAVYATAAAGTAAAANNGQLTLAQRLAIAMVCKASLQISRGTNGILSDEEIGNIVFNETRSLSGPGIDDARSRIVHIIINGDELLGAKRPATASAVLPKKLSASEQKVLLSIRAIVTAVRADREDGIDPTGGAIGFGFRDVTKFGSGFAGLSTVQRFGTQHPIPGLIVGPFVNSFPTKDLGPTGIYFVPFR